MITTIITSILTTAFTYAIVSRRHNNEIKKDIENDDKEITRHSHWTSKDFRYAYYKLEMCLYDGTADEYMKKNFSDVKPDDVLYNQIKTDFILAQANIRQQQIKMISEFRVRFPDEILTLD